MFPRHWTFEQLLGMSYHLDIPMHVRNGFSGEAILYVKRFLAENLSAESGYSKILMTNAYLEFLSSKFERQVITSRTPSGEPRYTIVCESEEDAMVAKLTHF